VKRQRRVIGGTGTDVGAVVCVAVDEDAMEALGGMGRTVDPVSVGVGMIDHMCRSSKHKEWDGSDWQRIGFRRMRRDRRAMEKYLKRERRCSC